MVRAMSKRPLVLITNDDGIGAPGLEAAESALLDIVDLITVVPDRERSACSHSINLHRPLRVKQLKDEPGHKVYTVDGTPVDCVYIALLDLCPFRPTLCLSGINRGYNLGSDVYYSGTVAGATEAALRGLPAVAFSQGGDQLGKKLDYVHSARLLRAMVKAMLPEVRPIIPIGTLLNVNTPSGPLLGFERTHLGHRLYDEAVEKRLDPRGRTYYWIGGPETPASHMPGADCAAVRNPVASMTLLGLDRTAKENLGSVQNLDLVGFQNVGLKRSAE